MQRVHLSDPEATPLACQTFGSARPVFMLQMPSVFALVAAPTTRGVQALDDAKQRLPGKTYGSLIGDLARFHALIALSKVPSEFQDPSMLDHFQGAFVRVPVGTEAERTAVLYEGTHQALLTQGHHRELFAALEAHCAPDAEPGLYCGHFYTAPLCSSANRSGAPGGSITTLERAEEFAHAREIPLMVLCDPEPGELGSYPIFCVHPNRISLARPGPGDAAIRARIDPHLLAP